jgi:hypothetical protein
VSILTVTYSIKHIIAMTSKNDVLSLCIPILIIYFISYWVGGFFKFYKPLSSGSKSSYIYGPKISFCMNFLIYKIITLKDGRRSLSVGYVTQID